MKLNYDIMFYDIAEGFVIRYHADVERGRDGFDTYEQCMEIIGQLKAKGYIPLNAETMAKEYMIDIAIQYAGNLTARANSEQE